MKHKLLSIVLMSTAMSTTALYAQEIRVTGKVTSETGASIPNVTVLVKNGNKATQTDLYGNFTITAKSNDELLFRSIGYSDKSVSINGAKVLNIKLETSSTGLDEVIVTAYGKQNKEAIVGAVSSISAKDIEKRPVSSVTSVLEGSAPGIMVNNAYGEPGSTPSIRIRGFSTITGNNASASPTIVLDGVEFQGNISDLNPADIESVSVLKDATSTALYGNRGSNGVIVITTKKGGAGSTELNFTTNQGLFTRGMPEYDRLDPKGFMEVAWQGLRNQYLWAPNNKLTVEQANAQASKNLIPTVLKLNIFDLADDQLFDANGNLSPNAKIKGDYASDLDWFAPVIRNGYRRDYNLNGRGGSEKGNYMFSLGYLGEDGYIKTSDFDRLSGRLSASVTPKSWITAGFSMNASHQNSNNTTGSGSGFTNPWGFARTIAPIYPVYLHDATTGEYVLDADGNKIYDSGETSRNQNVGRHFIWENELNLNKGIRNTLNSQAYVNLKFLKHFDFKVVGDINLRNDVTKSYNNAIIGDGAGNKGRASRTIYDYKNYTFQQQLTYTNTFSDKHNVDVFVGHENFKNWYNYLYGYKTNETFAGKPELINFSEITSLTDYQVERTFESYLSRVRYNYAEKYYVEGSFRRDGSSQVSPDHRWENFWSLGGTWMLSKENFIKDINWINTLKFRAATGVVGNLASLSEFDFMNLYAIGQNNNAAALYKSNIGNDALKWEASQSTSTALEGRLFNKLNFTLEYFNKTSKDLIFDVNLPLSVGAVDNSVGKATVKRNIGQLYNRGFEFSFDIDLIKNENFKWNFGANTTVLKNKITKMPSEYKETGLLSSPFNYKEGHNVYDYYLYQYAGVDMMTGQALYYADTERYDPTSTSGAWAPFQVEVNGKMYTRNASYAVRDWSGSAIPKLMGSFNNTFNYKNFNLSTLFTYSIGGKGFDYSYASLMGLSSTPSSVHADLANAWKEAPEGMTLTSPDRINRDAIPQVNYSNSQYNVSTVSNRFILNSSYLSLKNVALSYNFSKDLLTKLDLRRANVVFSAENLFTLTSLKGYNPQQSFNGTSDNQFVQYRVFSLGVTIGL
ncbi:SusC/RagA family TonB-linked outer membrane protein [Sphingobacterium siyangense]|uniref:SusC/RagA family TonB-linked outer membrane protein n=2 Tax=Sphingobacterium TaxID=28453 RepID=A0ABX7CLS0_SPHMU|nr:MULTISPECIES: SusC/RagA family TonB-linked outer membrane protein [Sphingobacterium]QQT31743.1 SusC/RagA family TonB-linked outer membrane protein [Sphingobacterium multivorum]QQT52315.1 SusC/RagA family TonB-linked outer membrane protein [Sphingobacterium multivorum]RKF33114.1 SusC/RagA family TonB-linked outer membrane protein [Sphingobacterium siyangense]